MEIVARKSFKGQVTRVKLEPGDTIHFIGIAGTAMAGVAGVLKSQGYNVVGSDDGFYPPMSDQLRQTNIPLLSGYDEKRINKSLKLVVVGNSISSKNIEADCLIHSDIPYVSLPEMISYSLMDEKQSLVISGTHGKTTTSSMMAWIASSAGYDPSFLIGGIPNNFNKSFNNTRSNWFIIEGDEYDTAFFDRRPKFIHYKPFSVILTSIEFDHVDIYENIEKLKSSFELLIQSIPQEGILVVNGEDKHIQSIVHRASCKKVIHYGVTQGDYLIQDRIPFDEDGFQKFCVRGPQGKKVSIKIPVYGLHNAMNALASYCLATVLGWDQEKILKGLSQFKGVLRRFQILKETDQVILVEDFAHHPTSAKATLVALRERFTNHEMVVVFEPRSASSRRKVFQSKYVHAFSEANYVYVAPPYKEEEISEEERFSSKNLVQDLKVRGKKAFYIEDTKKAALDIVKNIKTKSVIVIMSNGPFEGIHQMIKNHLS